MLVNEISFPFIYLDSSSLIRKNYNINILSRKNLKNNTSKFEQSLHEAYTISQDDNMYYMNINKLIKNNCICKLITYEVLNKKIHYNDNKIISLFKKHFQYNNDKALEAFILWGEEISHSAYYESAMAISASQCIIIDENFLSLNIGKKLVNYITTKSSVFIIGDKNNNYIIENANNINISPISFIEELSAIFN